MRRSRITAPWGLFWREREIECVESGVVAEAAAAEWGEGRGNRGRESKLAGCRSCAFRHRFLLKFLVFLCDAYVKGVLT